MSKTTIPHLDQSDGPPIPGKWYMVPHVRQYEVECPERAWDVPVRGHAHTDIEIGIKTKHLHFDHRFMTNAQRRVLFHHTKMVDSYIVPVEKVRAGENGTRISDGKIFLKRARCRPHTAWEGVEYRGGKWDKFARSYEGKELIDGKCPHKGYDMSKVPCDEEGRKRCPLHGLVFCGTTGRNISRDEILRP